MLGHTEDPVLAEEPPALNPNRRFIMIVRSRGGTEFRFENLTFGQVLARIEAAEPYGFTMIHLEETGCDPAKIPP